MSATGAIYAAANDGEAGPSVTNKRGSNTSLSRKAVPPAEAHGRILPVNDDDAHRPVLVGYAYSFFSPEISQRRRAYLKLLARATGLTILLTWVCLPIYWGSLSSSAKLTGNLNAWLVNRDQGLIGESLVAAVHEAATTGPGAIGWRIMNSSHIKQDKDIIHAVLNETIWMGVVVSTNATLTLNTARATGNSSYDPTSLITVYYDQARNDVATGTFLIPAATSFLSNFTTTYAADSVQRFFAAVMSANGTVNTTALHNVAQAPQALSPGVDFRIVNLRPYAPPVSQAVLLVGQIYLCIFTFMIAMAHDTARNQLSSHLSFFSYLGLRISTPLIIYLPLSVSVALVSLPFKLPFGGHFSYSTGFAVFWMYLYLGMAALGLALEAMITIMTRTFVPFFLVLWIVVNISTAALPPELQPKLYAYGSVFPFWNIQQADRTLFFNTYSHLPKNAAVLIAWILLSIGTLALFTWLMRYYDARCARRLQGLSRRSSGLGASGDIKTRVHKASGKEIASGADVDCASVKERNHGQEKDKLSEKERGYRDTGEEVGIIPVCEV